MPLYSFPIDYDAIREAIVDGITAATGLDANHVLALEPETANAPRPDRPYMGFKVTTAALKHGDDGVSYVGEPTLGQITLRYSGSRRMTVSFHAFGNSHEQAYGMMALWQAALNLPATREQLRDASLAVWQIGDVLDLSVLLATGFEGRAQMDVMLGVLCSMDTTVPTIEQAAVQGIFNDDPTAQQSVVVTVNPGV